MLLLTLNVVYVLLAIAMIAGWVIWEFRPLVQNDAAMAWNLLQTLAKRLRTAQDDQ